MTMAIRRRYTDIQFGDFRHYVTIQKESAVQDAAGQMIPGWTAITNGTGIPARKQLVSGGMALSGGTERQRGMQMEAGVTHLWTLHYRSDVLPQMRLYEGTDAFNIVRADDPEGNRRFLLVQTAMVPPAVS